MKANEWEFKGQSVDLEDMDAEIKAFRDFMACDLDYMKRMSERAIRMHCFIAGFYRGMSWHKAKNSKGGI